MTKKEARIHARNIRSNLEQKEIEIMQIEIENKFMSMDLFSINYLQSYMPLTKSKEVETERLENFVRKQNPNVVISYPRLIENQFMESVESVSETLMEKNMFGILEPIHGNIIKPSLLDLVLIPLLAFDLKGNRVGFGKGYYDRFLKKCKSNVVKIGLSYLDPVDFISDIDFYDVPLDYCITPKMIYAF